ncbi:MAG: universal stress protein [Deltaproteobacteria bacterium]|nr:universal stress protein [Deltaproteobacteria bacterium]
MTTTRPVLVATDLSDHASLALRMADKLAREQNAPLFVVHVLPEMYSVHALFPQLNLDAAFSFAALEVQAAEAVTKHVNDQTGRTIEEYKILLAHGTPDAGIDEQARQVNAGTIVVGASGRGVAHLLGRTVRRVVRHAPCDVLVVRKAGQNGVVVGTDFSDASQPAIVRAAEEAQRRHAKADLVYSLDFIPPGVALPGVDVPMPSLSALDQVRAQMQQLLQEQASKFGATPVLKEGPAAHSLAEVAREKDAGLVVVGTHGRTGFGRFALGSVAETVVETAPCSVLVVRTTPTS